MNKYIDKYIIKDILKQAVNGSILSFLLSIFIFMLIMGIDGYSFDMVYKHYIKSKYYGYILFSIFETVFVIFLIMLYCKIKIQELQKALLIFILFFSTHILTMVFIIFLASIDIDLPVDIETAYFLNHVFCFIFSYIMSLLSYIVYINYQCNSVCFNKSVIWKMKIIYVLLYILCGIIFLFALVILFFIALVVFSEYV